MPFSVDEDLVTGVDVSSFHRPDQIDYGGLVAAGVSFAIIRASDGNSTIDGALAKHVAGFRKAGIPVGIHQCCRLGHDPTRSACLLVELAQDAGWDADEDLPLWADMTSGGAPSGMTPAQATGWLRRFVATCDDATGRPTGIYASTTGWNSKIGAREFYDRSLWAPWYPVNDDIAPLRYLHYQPKPLYGWGMDYVIWQFTSHGNLSPAYRGNIDRNLMRRSDLDGRLKALRPRPERPSLRKGDRGNEVKTLQVFLEAVGFSVGRISGIFGEGTEHKVRAFQRSANLVDDGKVDDDTWRALTLS